ncbi:MAG: hypothetical protein NC210_00340 [[Clostridium] fimetarium]|nr:hypothetical protein [Alistipes timonensis]MCM1404852.1 hypothetical protein [[Clostridium] fimetarium]
MCSCGGDKPLPLSDYVTEEVSVATISNIDEVLRQSCMPLSQADQRPDSVRLRLIELATRSIMSDEVASLIMAGAVDDSEVLTLRFANRSDAVGVRVVDEDAFKTVAAECGFADSYVERGDLRFISGDLESVNELIEKVGTDAPPSVSKARYFLSDKGTVRAAIHYGAPAESDWITARFDVSANSISMEAAAFGTDGSQVAFGDTFDEIDPAPLSFIPADAALVAAFGKPRVELPGIDKLLKEFTCLESADLSGTSVFSLSLAGSADDPRMVDLSAFNAQFVTAAGEAVGDSLTLKVLDCRGGFRNAEGQYLTRFQDCDLWMLQADGCLAQSLNRPVCATYANSFGPIFEGKRAGISVEIPYGSALARNLRLPAGISINVTIGAASAKGRLKFYGTSAPAPVMLAKLDKDFAEWLLALPALLTN